MNRQGSVAYWDNVPDSDLCPEGILLFRVSEMTWDYSSTGKRMVKATYEVVEPQIVAGARKFDNYVIGNDEDMEAHRPETWQASIGAKQWKRVLTNAQVPLHENPEMVCNTAVGALFMAKVTVREDKQGTPRDNFSAVYKVGEKTPQLEIKQGGMSAGASAALDAAMPMPPPGMPQQQYAQQVAQPPPGTVYPPQQAQYAPPAAPPQQPAPPAAEPPKRGRGKAAAQPAAPAQQPLPQPPPAQYAPPPPPGLPQQPQQMQQAAPPQQQVAQAAQEQMFPCQFCNQGVPASQFVAHVQACAAQQVQQQTPGAYPQQA